MATYPNEQYRQDFQDGLEYQDFVMEVLAREGLYVQYYVSRKSQYTIGESRQGVEVKLDRRCTEGRLSIEIAAKTDARLSDWTLGGIYRADNTWLYVQGNYQLIFVFAKTTLHLLHATKRYQEHTLPTVRKFYLPLDDARKYAARTITP